MKNKIIGIFVMILFIGTVLPAEGIIDFNREHEKVNITYNSDFYSSNKYAWSGEGHGLDNEGIISVVVPVSFPVYLSFSTSYEIFSPDYGMVEISTDGGSYWYPLDSITGVQSGWTVRSVDISSFASLYKSSSYHNPSGSKD